MAIDNREWIAMPLEREDQRHLTAAEGYFELGMYQEADAELDEIDAFCRQLPEVLAVRVMIYSGLKKWALMQTVAQKLVELKQDEPDYLIKFAYATRRADSIESAKTILLSALELHTKEPMIHFNLACYEAQLGNIEQAKIYLKQATTLYPKCQELALDDADLEPLWNVLN